jgi:hypothetical protein
MARARRDYVLAQLEGEKTWSLLEAWRPEILPEAAEWLLAHVAADRLRRQRERRLKKANAAIR